MLNEFRLAHPVHRHLHLVAGNEVSPCNGKQNEKDGYPELPFVGKQERHSEPAIQDVDKIQP